MFLLRIEEMKLKNDFLNLNKTFSGCTLIFCSSTLCSTDSEMNNNLFLKIIFCKKYNKNLYTLPPSLESEWFYIEISLNFEITRCFRTRERNVICTTFSSILIISFYSATMGTLSVSPSKRFKGFYTTLVASKNQNFFCS